MSTFRKVGYRWLIGLSIATVISLAAVRATDLNPAALKFTPPDKIPWVENEAAGSAQAVLAGDPTKPGMYVVLTKWHAGHFSHPHWHPNDRYIVVLSGTWWVGTGTKFDPNNTVPMPAGTFVTHFGKQVHFDGAKNGDAVLEIVGEGPATNTPAEVK